MQPLIKTMMIPPGPAGTSETLLIMSILCKEGCKDNAVREFVADLFVRCYSAVPSQLIDNVDTWIRDHYSFVNDGLVELLRKPEYMVQLIRRNGLCVGDCDDISLLLATIYRCMELPVRFVAIKTSANVNFDHVFVEVYDGGQWLAMDPTTTKNIQHIDYGRMIQYA